MPASSELIIVRHAEARCDIDGIVGGPKGDAGLTITGRVQAAFVAAFLTQESEPRGFDAIYTGPRARLKETARIIATVVGAPLRTEAQLREQNYGVGVDARPWREIFDEFGGIPAWEPDRPLAEGGESWNTYVARIGRALGRLTARHGGQRIVVLGTSGTVHAAFDFFLDLPTGRTGRIGFDCAPTGLTTWRQVPAENLAPSTGLRWSLIGHNETGHLVGTAISKGLAA